MKTKISNWKNLATMRSALQRGPDISNGLIDSQQLLSEIDAVEELISASDYPNLDDPSTFRTKPPDDECPVCRRKY